MILTVRRTTRSTWRAGCGAVIVVAPDDAKVTGTATRAGVEAALARFRDVPQVAAVSDPFQSRAISPNGRAAIITVQYSVPVASVQASTLSALDAAAAPARSAGAEVEFSGAVYPGSAVKASEAPELIGIVIGFVILLITFGALTAAGLPLLTAIIGVGIGTLGSTALASVVTISSASTALALMLGLSCGIDYALFIASRHRANLLRDNVTIKAIGFGLAAAVLLDAFVVRLTLVPAVMSIVGSRIWYHPRWFARHVPDLDIEGARLEHDAPAPDQTIPV